MNRYLQFYFASLIKRVRLKWNFIVYDVQNATYSSHGTPFPERDLFPWLTRESKYISLYGQYVNIRKDILCTSRIRGKPSYHCYRWYRFCKPFRNTRYPGGRLFLTYTFCMTYVIIIAYVFSWNLSIQACKWAPPSSYWLGRKCASSALSTHKKIVKDSPH